MKDPKVPQDEMPKCEVIFARALTKGNRRLAVQSCFSLGDHSTRTRELSALAAIRKELNIQDLGIVTIDESADIVEDGMKVRVRPIYRLHEVLQ